MHRLKRVILLLTALLSLTIGNVTKAQDPWRPWFPLYHVTGTVKSGEARTYTLGVYRGIEAHIQARSLTKMNLVFSFDYSNSYTGKQTTISLSPPPGELRESYVQDGQSDVPGKENNNRYVHWSFDKPDIKQGNLTPDTKIDN
jgi:hypothetical protein